MARRYSEAVIDILVPVLGRPEAAQPLSESLCVTVTPYRLLFICNKSAHADIEAFSAFGEVLVAPWAPGRADFAKKINLGFRMTENEWIFQGATDIRFSAGWDTAAIDLGLSRRKRVIGTNDLHNPNVKRGKGSTHTLFARSYILERGGTEDGSGIVFSEAYDHQYVDNEFIEVARRRNEWVFSTNSVVEHFHPHWGNREPDATYKKATRNSHADRMLYMERMGLNHRKRSNRPRA